MGRKNMVERALIKNGRKEGRERFIKRSIHRKLQSLGVKVGKKPGIKKQDVDHKKQGLSCIMEMWVAFKMG